MAGILKNPLPKDQVNKKEDNESITEFRKQVFKNTQLNAKLTQKKDINIINEPFHNAAANGKHITSESEEVPTTPRRNKGPPKDTLLMKQEEDERLQWNNKNLEENEITKQQFQDVHVDEPKTPYQGAVDPEGEYYRDDEEEEDIPKLEDDDLNNFTLGEPEFEIRDTDSHKEKKDVEIVVNDENEDDQDEDMDEEVAKEQRHKKFEELRKKHYNLKEMFKNKKEHPEDFEAEGTPENEKNNKSVKE